MSTDAEAPTSVRHTFRSDPILAQRIDKAVDEHGYMDESEFVREALRAHIRRVNGRAP